MANLPLAGGVAPAGRCLPLLGYEADAAALGGGTQGYDPTDMSSSPGKDKIGAPESFIY
jgi:hypothetical protein